MADRKISDLTALTTPASGDFLPIVDISEAAAASKNKRITIEELMRGVPNGTAAAPGIAFETYPSTGVYSSGANQLAVATNGTGRLFVDASGRVGIGGSPNKLLELASFNDSSAEGNTLRFTDIDGSASINQQIGRIEFFTSDATQSGVQSFILGAADDFAGSGSLRFGTGLAGSAAEKLRITAAGLVGIGTSSPGSPLTIAGNYTGTSNMLELRTTAGGADGGGRIVWKKPQDEFLNSFISSSRAGAASAGQIEFGTAADIYAANATTKMVILGSGNVGIGTTAPAEKLTVSTGTDADAGNISIGLGSVTAGATRRAVITKNTTSPFEVTLEASSGGTAVETIFKRSGTLESARIDNYGRLLVGASADSGGALLQVNGDRIRVATAKTPASATATGTAGEICWDASYVYVCTATNTWKRTAISTW